jgi:hypothetical protein
LSHPPFISIPFPSGRGAGPSGACVGFHSLTVIEVYHSAITEYRTKREKYDRLFLGFSNRADANRQRQRESSIQQHTGSPAQRQQNPGEADNRWIDAQPLTDPAANAGDLPVNDAPVDLTADPQPSAARNKLINKVPDRKTNRQRHYRIHIPNPPQNLSRYGRFAIVFCLTHQLDVVKKISLQTFSKKVADHSEPKPSASIPIFVWKKYQVFSKAAEILLEKMKKVFEK